VKLNILCNCKNQGLDKIIGSGYLKVVYSHIAAEWDYERNQGIPENYTPKSNNQ